MELLRAAWHAHRPGAVAEVPFDLTLDRASGERRERCAVLWVEAVDRLDERDHRDLTDVLVVRAPRQPTGDVGGEAHVELDQLVAEGLPDEVSGEGYLNSLSPLQLEQYLKVADKVLGRIVAPAGAPPTAVQKRLFGASPAAGADPRKAARDVARTLARKAYRRPPSEAELDVLVETYDLGRRNKLAHPQALHLMLKAVLVSPQFLFITPAAGEGGASSAKPAR